MGNNDRLGNIDLDAAKTTAMEGLEEGFKSELNDVVGLLVWAIRDSDKTKAITWASVLSCKFGIEPVDVLSKPEFNKLLGLRM